MAVRKATQIGPFSRGMNTFDDPTALHDQECAEALNFDSGLDGSLKGRPPFTDTLNSLPLGASGTPKLLGYYYDSNGAPYLIASDGKSSTWSYASGAWTLITSTYSATDMAQFDGKAWLPAAPGTVATKGYWTPTGGFVTSVGMPNGVSITAYKSRLWIAEGVGGPNPTRIRYSKVLGQPDFWVSPGFVDVGAGDGENVVKIITYYDVMLVFRTKSIWSFQYSSDPASAIQGVIVPGIGLQSPESVVAYENYLYFMYDENAYSFINNRAQQINIKVPFKSSRPDSTSTPYAVSLFNNRILYSFFENIYVYSLRTQTWTMWRSDVHGPIGQLLMPMTDDMTGIGYAITSSSIPVEHETGRNYESNPRAVSTGSGSAYLTRYSWTRAFVSTGSPTPEGLNTVARLTSTETGTVSGRGVDSYGNPDLASPGTSGSWTESPLVTPGETITVSRYTRMLITSAFMLRVRFHDGAGNWVSTLMTDSSMSVPLLNNWRRVSWTGVVPAGAKYLAASLINTSPDAITTSNFMDVTGLMTVKGELRDYFDGSLAATTNSKYSWAGTANASDSIETSRRWAPLLRIEDSTTDATEDMVCSLTTKNYNFEAPGSLKVLFWWGVDAIFKKDIQGVVIPGVFNLSTTWAEIRNNTTWGGLRLSTWRFPYMSDRSVVSDVSTGMGPVRKFVKFFKKLRFRQLQFRVSFRTDGSKDSAPVQIFTISTYMTEKQTVSKTIS